MLCGVTNAVIGKRIEGRTSWQQLAVSSGNGGGHLTRTDQRRWAQATSMWGRRNGQKENWATADPTGRHVQEISKTAVTISQTPERTEYTQHSYNEGYKLRKHKQKVVAPVYLVVQVPTDETEMKGKYNFQVSVRRL
jgi:hypothetical protein